MASTSVQPPQELAAAWPLSSTSPSISTSAPSQQYQVSPELSQPSVVQPVHQHVPLAHQPQPQQQQQAMGDFAPSHLAAIPATNNPTSSGWYYHDNNGWKWTRIVLHGLCLVASIAGLAVSGLLVSGTSRIGLIKEPNVALGVFLLTLILSVVELAARFVPHVKRDNGLNPNIAVGGWLLSAWSAIPTAVINAIIIAQYYAGDYYDDDQEEAYQTYVDYMGSTRKEFLNRTIATTAILGIVAVAAFALWVGACVEAARYNKSIGAARSSGVAGPKTVYADGWGRFKMALNILGFVFCAIGGALSVSLIVYQNMAIGTDNDDTPSDGSYRYHPDYDEVAETFPFFSLIFFVPLLWIAAELCTVLARKRKAGIHPGAHVGLWLVFLFGISLGAGAMLTSGPISSKCWPNIDRPTSDGYRVSVSNDPKCVSERGIAAASIVFACLMVVVACFLFIAACADTAVRNATQVTTYVYMPFQDQHAQGSMQPVQLANGKTAMAMVYGAPPAQPAQVYAPVPAPPNTVWETRQ